MTNRKSIVIFDDGQPNSQGLSKLFSQCFDVIEVKNGKEAIGNINEKTELAFLNFAMPEISAIEVIEFVNNSFANKIPMILIADNILQEDINKAYEIGVRDVISSGFNPLVVFNRAKKIIELCKYKRMFTYDTEQEIIENRNLCLLELEREKNKILLKLSDNILFNYDVKTDIAKFSSKYIGKFGNEAIFTNMREKLNFTQSISEEDKSRLFSFVTRLDRENTFFKIRVKIRDLQGVFEWYDLCVSVILNPQDDTEILGYMGKITNIEKIKHETECWEIMAKTDQLTGLYNKKTTEELVMEKINIFPQNNAALMFIDIDNFKMINDKYGHIIGDEVLEAIGKNIKKNVRKTDIVGRVGGDEFIIFLNDISSNMDLSLRAEKICNAFQYMHRNSSDVFSVSASIGIAMFPKDGTEYKNLLKKADIALYYDKRCGENRYEFYYENMDDFAFRPLLDDHN